MNTNSLIALCHGRLRSGAASIILGDEHLLNTYLYGGKRCKSLAATPWIKMLPRRYSLLFKADMAAFQVQMNNAIDAYVKDPRYNSLLSQWVYFGRDCATESEPDDDGGGA
jgi:hypothetical protein